MYDHNRKIITRKQRTDVGKYSFVNYYYYYYWYSALGLVRAETRVQSGDWYGSGTLHPGQVLRGSLPLLSPAFQIFPLFTTRCLHVRNFYIVNRTIKSWNQLPASLLVSFPCKLNTFKKWVKTGRGETLIMSQVVRISTTTNQYHHLLVQPLISTTTNQYNH